jgi:hypothetical protein
MTRMGTALLASHLENIPAELRTPKLWIPYELKIDSPDKKPRKAPVMKWGTPELRAANCRSLDYLLEREAKKSSSKTAGFQRFIEKEEGLVYIDLDHVRNKDTGEVESWALKLIEDLDSYTEISASGEGLHIVCKGTLPEDFHPAGSRIEIYAGISGKLLAMTGEMYHEILYRSIEDRQALAAQLLKQAKSGTATPTAEVKNWREVFHTGNELDTTPSRVFIKGILEEGITFIGAHSGAGKTWLGLSISHALTTGELLFGFYPVIERTNVLYLVPEMGSSRFRARMVKMHVPMDDRFYCHTVRDGAIDLDAPVLLRAIAETKAIVVLDTAIRFQSGDEQSSTQQSQGLGRKMFDLIRAGAPAVICMHHRSKDLKDSAPTLQNTLRGTGDFGAMADCVWCVEHSTKSRSPEYEQESKTLTRLTLTCVKPRDMEPADPFMIQGRPHIDQKGDFAMLDRRDAAEEPVSKDGDEKVLELVRANPSIGIMALRNKLNMGEARVLRILSNNKFEKKDGAWVSQDKTEELGFIQ